MGKHILDDAESVEIASRGGDANRNPTKKRKLKTVEEPEGSNETTENKHSKEKRKLKRLNTIKTKEPTGKLNENVTLASNRGKLKDIEKPGTINGAKGNKVSKDERRELKPVKRPKSIKPTGRPEEETPLSNEVDVEDDEGPGISNGAAGNILSKSKEGRKELKRVKRLRTKNLVEESGMLPSSGLEMKVEKEDRTADKAARKAEKARLRAAKKAQTNHGIPEIEASASKSKPLRRRSTSPTENSDAAQSVYKEAPSLTALAQSYIDTFLLANFIKITDPISSNNLRPIIDFSQLPEFSSTVFPFTNFKSPTPIQAAAWPFLLSGRDVVGVAETGSGKTLAFGVPCIRSITTASRPEKSESCTKAIIVSPTRELAVQIHDQISKLTSAAGLRSVCIYGGVPKDAQRLALRKAHIIVATPGRLNDFLSENSADLGGVMYLVLDEADRMLDKGFEPEIRKIIMCTPPTGVRQTLMFTATWPPSVRTLASSFMRNPVHISIGRDNPDGALRANTSITQRVEVIYPYEKQQRLLQLIKEHQSGSSANDRILVFCLYKKEATRVEESLRLRGLRVAAIHGDLSQERRSASLESFKSGECPLLVATDVAARGLDIPAVKLVLNVTFPLTVEDYVHRIGR